MNWTAEERSATCGGALPGAGGSTTVVMQRMLGSFAQVRSVHCPWAEEVESSKEVGVWSPDDRRWLSYRGLDIYPSSLRAHLSVRMGFLLSSCQSLIFILQWSYLTEFNLLFLIIIDLHNFLYNFWENEILANHHTQTSLHSEPIEGGDKNEGPPPWVELFL